MARFAAKLLFQFRIAARGTVAKARVVENRIVIVNARNGESAWRLASKIGKNRQFSFLNDDRNPVHFEFIGIRELIGLDPECLPEEVWYSVGTMIRPMERRSSLIPKKSDLLALRADRTVRVRSTRRR